MPGLTNLPTGRIINNIGIERAGLGDVSTRWPDLRIWAEGYKVSIEPDNSRVLVPFKCPWDRASLLAAELVGWPYLDGANGMKRHLPESFRNWQWILDGNPTGNSSPIPVLYCTRAEVSGVGGSDNPESFSYAQQNPANVGIKYYPDPMYQFARVNAVFETLACDVKLRDTITGTSASPIEMQRNVVKKETSGGRFQVFQYGQWRLQSGSNFTEPLSRQQNFWESFNTVRYTWLDVLPEAFNYTQAKLLQGKSNNAPFDIYPTETLILMKVDRERKKHQLGIRTYEVTFEFLEVPSGVNKARPPSPEQRAIAEYWDIVPAMGVTADKPYPSANMSVLFIA